MKIARACLHLLYVGCINEVELRSFRVTFMHLSLLSPRGGAGDTQFKKNKLGFNSSSLGNYVVSLDGPSNLLYNLS